ASQRRTTVAPRSPRPVRPILSLSLRRREREQAKCFQQIGVSLCRRPGTVSVVIGLLPRLRQPVGLWRARLRGPQISNGQTQRGAVGTRQWVELGCLGPFQLLPEGGDARIPNAGGVVVRCGQ